MDYKQPDGGDRIREASGGNVELILDCIGTPTSTTICYETIGKSEGKYTSLTPFPERLRKRRRNVRPEWILGYVIFGGRITIDKDHAQESAPEDRRLAAAWMQRMETLVQEGGIKPHPIQLQPHGLRGIMEDWEIYESEGVSGRKLVYNVNET